MKQDKLFLIIQYFFRLLSLSFVPALLVWLYLTISFLFFKDHILTHLFSARNILVVPTSIPFSIFITTSISIVGGVLSFLLYHLIANLIKHIRENKIDVSIVKKLRQIATLFMIGFIFDAIFYLNFNLAPNETYIFNQALGLIGPIIDSYHFIYVEFVGITALAMFFITTFLARFLEYHFQLKNEQDLTI